MARVTSSSSIGDKRRLTWNLNPTDKMAEEVTSAAVDDERVKSKGGVFSLDGPSAKRKRPVESSCETLKLQAFEWATCPLQGVSTCHRDDLLIRCWCKNASGEIHLLLFKNFPCTVYLELPEANLEGKALPWRHPQVKSVLDYLKSSSVFAECRPFATELVRKCKLYYAESPDLKFVRARFSGERDMRKFCKLARVEVTLSQLGRLRFLLHEDNVQILSKFLVWTGIKCTQWFQVKAVQIAEGPLKISLTAREYEADFETISPIECETMVPYKVLSFDIEVYSSVGNSFPKAMVTEDEIFAISVVTQTFHPEEGTDADSGAENRRRWCLCLGAPLSYSDMCDAGLLPEGDGNEVGCMPYETVRCSSESSGSL